MGYNGNGRANVIWRPDTGRDHGHRPPRSQPRTCREDDRATADQLWGSLPATGFFAYTCGCLVVVEDLHSGSQQHWLGHSEEISTLALSHDAQVLLPRPGGGLPPVGPPIHPEPVPSGLPSSHSPPPPHPPCQVLASASGSSGAASGCQIRIWDVPGGSCQQLLSHHCTAVQALAFSLDDRLLVTLGWLRRGGVRRAVASGLPGLSWDSGAAGVTTMPLPRGLW